MVSNLRRLRRKQLLTQERLGQRCGFSKTYISNVENGNMNITLRNLERISEGLGVEAWMLLKPPPITRS